MRFTLHFLCIVSLLFTRDSIAVDQESVTDTSPSNATKSAQKNMTFLPNTTKALEPNMTTSQSKIMTLKLKTFELSDRLQVIKDNSPWTVCRGKEKENLTLTCEACGLEPPQVRLIRDGAELATNTMVTDLPDRCTRVYHTGPLCSAYNLSCLAEDSRGMNSSLSKLITHKDCLKQCEGTTQIKRLVVASYGTLNFTFCVLKRTLAPEAFLNETRVIRGPAEGPLMWDYVLVDKDSPTYHVTVTITNITHKMAGELTVKLREGNCDGVLSCGLTTRFIIEVRDEPQSTPLSMKMVIPPKEESTDTCSLIITVANSISVFFIVFDVLALSIFYVYNQRKTGSWTIDKSAPAATCIRKAGNDVSQEGV